MSAAAAASSLKQHQTQPAWGNKPINGIESVMEAITHLGMPNLTKEEVSYIANSLERAKFKTALEVCLGLRGEMKPADKQYLFGFVSCMSGMMNKYLAELGYPAASYDTLLYIGSKRGMEFRSAVKAAMTPKDPNRESCTALVKSILLEAADATGDSISEAIVNNQVQPKPVQAAAIPVNTTDEREASRTEDTEEPTTRDEIEEDATEYLSTHVYALKYALCFNAALSSNNKNHTIIVDAGLIVGEKKVDWQNAVKIQLSHKEIPLVYSVLMGKIPKVKFEGHGAANNKGFEIERQDGKFYAKVFSKEGGVRAVPIGPLDAFALSNVVFSQIMKQVPKVLRDQPLLVHNMIMATTYITP